MKTANKKSKLTKLAIETLKFIGELIFTFILILLTGIMFLSADMTEHPDMSGYDPETQPYEIAIDILQDIATA